MRRIFQYIDPNVSLDVNDDNNTRWIAASTQEAADEAAKRRGWIIEGTGNRPVDHECFTPSYIREGCPKNSDREYRKLGCDVVLA